jgi:predicted RNA-binding Zn-ribbon protein involved in translation (DUF1610 family)
MTRTEPRAAKATRVQCPACGAACDAASVLAACTVSWPNQRWLLFECPVCGRDAHVEVSNGRLAIGSLDGAPGPCFFPTQTLALRGLQVTADAGGVTVVFKGKRRRVPAMR